MTTSLKAKDYFKKDMNTFFNVNEHGDTHNIDGKDIVVIVDNETLKERQIKSAQGTFIGGVLFYVEKSKLERMPRVGRSMEFDNEAYIVADVTLDGDMYSITLEANMS